MNQPSAFIWPQFRGVNGMGVAADEAMPPVTLNDKNLLWKTELPFGVSSPVIWNDRIFLTGFVDSTRELQTLCLDRKHGSILWKNSVIPDTLEKYHPIASPAQGTVATDGDRVVAYFGSCGLVCYDVNGSFLWRYKLPCNQLWYGHGTSPVIAEEKVIFFNDSNPQRFLTALDKITGIPVWRVEFPFPTVNGMGVSSSGGHSVPCIFGDMILLNRVGGVSCYSLTDGKMIFSYPCMTAGNATPFVSGNFLFATTWYNFSEKNQRGDLPSFDGMLAYDKNGSGKIEKEEIPEEMIIARRPYMDYEGTSHTTKELFRLFDSDKDQGISRKEWDDCLKLLNDVLYKPAGLIALSMENKGDLGENAVVWRVPDNVPEVPSPILYKGRVYMVKEGIILTCIDPTNGKVVYLTRLGLPGAIFASPVAANGYIYFFSHNGKMKVVKAGDTFQVVSEYDFKEKIGATPAIVGNTIYIRAGRNLYAFGI